MNSTTDEFFACAPAEGKQNVDRHLTAQFWNSSEPHFTTYLGRPERTVVAHYATTYTTNHDVRTLSITDMEINGRPVHPDMLRYVQAYWATHGPGHMTVPRAVQHYRRRMSAMHAAYRQKRKKQ